MGYQESIITVKREFHHFKKDDEPPSSLRKFTKYV